MSVILCTNADGNVLTNVINSVQKKSERKRFFFPVLAEKDTF